MSAKVSILLPTFNRARFLPGAFASIFAQTLREWELVVVDDGSTDESDEVIRAAVLECPRPVVRVKQANAGAYAARNAALDRAAAPFVAFYDSDDLWLPHHLEHCVRELEANPDVDWVYAACRTVEYETGRELDRNTFLLKGQPRAFRSLHTSRRRALYVFDDAHVVACAFRAGLYCGLQNSVIRRSVFDAARFRTAFRNEAEDQLFVIRALKRGHRLGYIDDIHVQYHVHASNSSASATNKTVERQLGVYGPLVRGFEELRGEFTWTALERRELAQRLARDYFWLLGYSILWKGGRRREALDAYRKGLSAWPWSLACWKTYLLARLQLILGRGTGA